jgi:Ca2+-binding RTX toxin-like protein
MAGVRRSLRGLTGALGLAVISAMILAPSAGAVVFTNATPITIPNINVPPNNIGNPYPSTIAVSGISHPVTKVTVTLNGVGGSESNMDVLLVAPGSQTVELMSDVCANPGASTSNLTFDDAAAAPLSGACPTGTYLPTSLMPGEPNYAAPAPAGPYGTTVTPLAATPNGTWQLFTRNTGDDFPASIAGGWSLRLDQPASAAAPAKGTGSCAGRTANIIGTAGNDVITGTPGPDVISALGGNDRVRAGGGNDFICGGAGRDNLSGQRGRDRALGQAGKDKLNGGPQKDTLIGGKGKDKLKGQGGRDVCKGNAGKDTAASCEKERSL